MYLLANAPILAIFIFLTLFCCCFWVLLYGAVRHWMVITEEEHLRAVFGEAYARYCERIPRYISLRRQ